MLYFLKNYLLLFGCIYSNFFCIKSLDEVSFCFLDFDFQFLIKNRFGICGDSSVFFGGFYHFRDKIHFSILFQPELTWTPYYVFNIYYTWNDLAAGFSIYNHKGMRVFYFSFRSYLFFCKRFSLLGKGAVKILSFRCEKKLGVYVNNNNSSFIDLKGLQSQVDFEKDTNISSFKDLKGSESPINVSGLKNSIEGFANEVKKVYNFNVEDSAQFDNSCSSKDAINKSTTKLFDFDQPDLVSGDTSNTALFNNTSVQKISIAGDNLFQEWLEVIPAVVCNPIDGDECYSRL